MPIVSLTRSEFGKAQDEIAFRHSGAVLGEDLLNGTALDGVEMNRLGRLDRAKYRYFLYKFFVAHLTCNDSRRVDSRVGLHQAHREKASHQEGDATRSPEDASARWPRAALWDGAIRHGNAEPLDSD